MLKVGHPRKISAKKNSSAAEYDSRLRGLLLTFFFLGICNPGVRILRNGLVGSPEVSCWRTTGPLRSCLLATFVWASYGVHAESLRSLGSAE